MSKNSRWCPNCKKWVKSFGDEWEEICPYCWSSTYSEPLKEEDKNDNK